MEFIDAHGHITNDDYDNVEQVVKNALDAGVKTMICSSSDLSSSKKAVSLAQEYDCVFANVGIHPECVNDLDESALAEIENLAKQKKVVAVGEIGLDYHTSKDFIQKQKEFFVKQIEIANKLDLPIVVHSREAMGDTIEILQKHPPKRPSLMHCYNGSLESAKILMKLGFSFSVGGLVTFKNAKNVQEVVANLPIENILLETDCPYMTPVPFRGQRNEPKNVVYTADAIAKLKNISIEEVASITTENSKRLYNI